MNTPHETHRLLQNPLRHLIGGEWVAQPSGQPFDIINPSNGQVLGHASLGSADDVNAAVQAAHQAFGPGGWSRTKPSVRAALIGKLADLLEQHADEFALLETLNTGKPIKVSRGFDVVLSVESLRYNAGWATKLNGETRQLSLDGDWHAYTVRQPLGVAALIVPWNVPLAITVSKLGAALAAGCCVVIKPAELTPLTAVRLGELCLEAGIPAGVVNIVLGLGSVVGQALTEHPLVDKISFTGSTEVGRRILTGAAGNFKRVSLELGGKSPVFVFPDADLSRAIPAAVMGIFGNTGQVCAAGSRLFVHRKVYDQVLDGIAQIAGMLRVGPGLDPQTDIGPLISAQHRHKVQAYIDSGVQEGAEVMCGGRSLEEAGFFIQPTVMRGTQAHMKMVREEIFGPVLSTFVFDDHDSLESLAAHGNDTPYGLSASVWTSNVSNAHKLAHQLRAGSVRINTALPMEPAMPFGGFKQSGWGRENGREGVEAFTELKSVVLELN